MNASTGPAPKPRTWRVDGDLPDGSVSDELFFNVYQECAVVQARLGGAILVVPDRRMLHDGTFVNIALAVKWESFVPTTRMDEGDTGHIEKAIELSPDQLEALDDAEAAELAREWAQMPGEGEPIEPEPVGTAPPAETVAAE